RENVERLDPANRALLDAYATGVNAGLAALDQSPPEYVFLRTSPKPWEAEDVMLVAFAMAMDLSDGGSYELSLNAVRSAYGDEAAEFLAPLYTVADAALDGSKAETVPSI